MSYVNHSNIPAKIEAEEPFEGNTMRGVVVSGVDQDGSHVAHYGRLHATDEQYKFVGRSLRYIVYSYQTPIAAVTDTGEVILVDHKFSVTTSKHQGLARQAFRNHPEAAEWLPVK